jgi:hypothetical protein
LNCIFNSFKIVDNVFSLFSTDNGSSSATADDLL